MIELGQVLEGLVQRTEEGKLKWWPSMGSDRYVTSVGAISIAIEGTDPPSVGVLGQVLSNCRLEILDEAGEIVESLSSLDTSDDHSRLMARLHILARRSAKNIDINSVLSRLAEGLEL